MWIDSHCHLPTESAGDLVNAALDAGVEALVTVGCTVPGSIECIALADRDDSVWATAGVHPHDAAGGIDGLAEVAVSSPRVVAIGECGLDYHYLHSPEAEQRRVFAAQIGLAERLDLALVIHTREAWDETFAILESEGTPSRTVFHCFTGGPVELERCLALGASISLSGIVTFASASELREAARRCPADRLVIETDSPYLAPVPHRGAPNRPEFVAVVGAAVAELRGEDLAGFAARTSANTSRLFGLSATLRDPDTSR